MEWSQGRNEAKKGRKWIYMLSLFLTSESFDKHNNITIWREACMHVPLQGISFLSIQGVHLIEDDPIKVIIAAWKRVSLELAIHLITSNKSSWLRYRMTCAYDVCVCVCVCVCSSRVLVLWGYGMKGWRMGLN